MARGILEVLLVNACCIKDTDFFGNMDPYVLIHYGKQERKSMVAPGKGSHPEWNQKFTFEADYPEGNKLNQEYKLTFTIMDKDTLNKDDFVGESTIYVKDLLSLGVDNGIAELYCTKYSVVLKDKTYYGEIQVALKFTVEDKLDKDLGEWKESVISDSYHQVVNDEVPVCVCAGSAAARMLGLLLNCVKKTASCKCGCNL